MLVERAPSRLKMRPAGRRGPPRRRAAPRRRAGPRPGVLAPVEQGLRLDAVGRRVRQRHPDLAAGAELGALHAVEGDHG